MPQQLIALNITTLAIAVIYYLWRDGYIARIRREQVLRERVAFMLWTAAQRM